MAEKLEPLHFRNLRVPQVRLVKLADKLSKDEAEASELEDVTRDLISVEVSQHASGPGEYKLTLVNWDPERRRHKYNDFATLQFGTRLRIDMRYVADTYSDVRNPETPKESWVPMIAGPVTEIQFSFGSEGSRLSITGEDDLHPLKDHRDVRVTYKDNEETIIRHTLEDYPIKLEIPKLPKHLEFITNRSSQNRINESHEMGQSYLEYILKFVDKYDLELFLSFDPPDKNGKINQTLNLVPSRANDGPLDAVIVLRHGFELLEFNPTIKVADQFTSVHIRGRNRYRDEPKGVDGKVDGGVVAEEVKRYQEVGDPELVPAPVLRTRFFHRPNQPPDKEKTNLDEYRAEAAARAVMLRKARELVVVQAATVGLPRLRPGRYVRIEALDDLFNGLYYVSSTTHTCGSDGARTRFSLQRAGIPLDKTGVAA